MRTLLVDKSPSYVRALLSGHVIQNHDVAEAKRVAHAFDAVLVNLALFPQQEGADHLHAFIQGVSRPVIAFSDGDIDEAWMTRAGVRYSFRSNAVSSQHLAEILERCEVITGPVADVSMTRHISELRGTADVIREYAAREAATADSSQPIITPANLFGRTPLPEIVPNYAEEVPFGPPTPRVRMPLVRRREPAPTVLTLPLPLHPDAVLTLLIEDDSAGLRIARDVFRHVHHVHLLRSVTDAVQMPVERLAQYGIVILSLRPSFGPGYSALVELVKRYPGPIIIMYDAANAAFVEAASARAFLVLDRARYADVLPFVAPDIVEPLVEVAPVNLHSIEEGEP